MRKTQRRELLRIARRRQRDVLCDVMLSARQCETWLTLDELSKLTHLPAGKHLRAIAAPAEAGVWKLCGAQAPASDRQVPARRRFRNGLGVSDQAGDSPEVRRCGFAGRWEATPAAVGGLLNRGEGAEEER
jgi:hypothetical protein